MVKSAINTPVLYVRQDVGQGRPIVLLHGMFGDGTQWRVVASLLSDYYRVIVVDLLGHGKSPRPKHARYTPAEHSLSLRKTLESIHATEDVTIVGYSMGGTVALQYAADYHDVAQLYLISTPFYLKSEEMVKAGYANSLFYTKLSIGLYRLVERMLKPGKLLYKIVGKEDLMKWLHTLIDAYDNKLDPDIMRKNLKELINEYTFAANLKKVTAPITFYAGKRDVFVVQSQLRALKKIQPLMEIQTLGLVKNDHAVVQYLPHQIADVLKRNSSQLLHVGYDSGKGSVHVLLHGIETSSKYWSNIVPALAEKQRIIALDLLGFGKSPKPLNIAYSLNDQVEWIHRTLVEKGIVSFELTGHSLGALVALAYAATYPKEVQKLNMISPVLYDEAIPRKKFIMKRLKWIGYFADMNYLSSTVVKAVGWNRLHDHIPSIRTVANSVEKQDSKALARKARTIDTIILYGEKDPLIETKQLETVAKEFRKITVSIIPQTSHNPSLQKPKRFMTFFKPDIVFVHRLKKSSFKPKILIHELLRIALPVLTIKGLAYVSAGMLMFSEFKEESLVAALTFLILLQSIQIIRGSFSLKNEGLSYASYFAVGIVGVGLGYLLANLFDISLKIAVITLCGYVLANGMARLLAGWLWTADTSVRRRQVVSGLALSLIALAAFAGSYVSVYAIIYALAGYLIVRGIILLSFAAAAFFIGYVRSH